MVSGAQKLRNGRKAQKLRTGLEGAQKSSEIVWDKPKKAQKMVWEPKAQKWSGGSLERKKLREGGPVAPAIALGYGSLPSTLKGSTVGAQGSGFRI